MKKSQVVNNLLKPNKIIEGKENKPSIVGFYKMVNNTPIFFPKRKKRK